jgi:hypothetical protein
VRKYFNPIGLTLLIFLTVSGGYAVPIKPDLQKILKQQEQKPRHYEPAQAGWNGPEMVRPQEAAPNPVYEAYGPASTVRAIRASLSMAAKPDPVALLGIGLLILMLRLARQERSKRARAAVAFPIRVEPKRERRAA